MTVQTRANGTLQHLLTLEGMTRAQIEALLARAQKFVKPVGQPPVQNNSLAGITDQLNTNDPQWRSILANGPGAADEASALLSQVKPTAMLSPDSTKNIDTP